MNDDLSDREMHDAGACGGIWAACEFCDEERAERMAARIEVATPPEFACRTCNRETGGPSRCLRCQFKYDQIEAGRLYDYAVASDIERGR